MGFWGGGTPTDKNSPHRHTHKQSHISTLLQRKQHREDVVRQTLSPSIDRIECIRRKRGGDDPFVMPFVHKAIDKRVVLEAVDEVDGRVGEEDEEWVLEVCP